MGKPEIIDIAITALEEAYKEYSNGKSMEYTFGYMDALAELKKQRDGNRPHVRRACAGTH